MKLLTLCLQNLIGGSLVDGSIAKDIRQRTQSKNVTTNQNAGHRKSRQNEKKEGRYRIQKKIQNGYLNS